MVASARLPLDLKENRYILYFVCLLLHIAAAEPVEGHLVDANGRGVPGALVIASGVGMAGWASSDAIGWFRTKDAGAFLSVRHAAYQPVILKLADLAQPVRIELKPITSSRRIPVCRPKAPRGKPFSGVNLQVKPPASGASGPFRRNNETHWYVKRNGQTLHLVNGVEWHSGLPNEQLLKSSRQLAVRRWLHGDSVVLDVTGQTAGGKRWRWIGAPLFDAIEYSGADLSAARYFDRLMESLCYAVQ
jgi:hypothetical protein